MHKVADDAAQNEFRSAFAEGDGAAASTAPTAGEVAAPAAQEGDAAGTQPATTPAAVEGATGDAGATAAEGDTDTGGTNTGGTNTEGTGTPPAAAAPAEGDKSAEFLALERQYKELSAKLEELRTQAPQQPQQTQQPQQAPQQAPKEQPMFTADEEAAIRQYVTDFPDVARGEALLRRAEYTQLAGNIFAQVQQMLAPIAQQLAPVQETIADVLANAHYNSIVAAHSDYDNIVEKVESWIENQPAGIRQSLQQIATSGSTEDVISLITLFKQVTAASSTAPQAVHVPAQQSAAPAAVAPAVVPQAGLPSASKAKQAADRLSAVPSQRTDVTPQAPSVDDFMAAFREFVSNDRN